MNTFDNDNVEEEQKPKYIGNNTTYQLRSHIGNGEYSDYETRNSPFATPWGRAVEVTLFKRGLREVTATKGSGFMISKSQAKKVLSPGALAVSREYGGYVSFKEESGLSTVFYYEFPEVSQVLLGREVTLEEVRKDVGEELFATYMEANGENVVDTITESSTVRPLV